MKVLMVLTSHGELGNTGEKTGFWIEEFAAPYYVLEDAGVEITLASPKGGQPPIDPKSEDENSQTHFTRRFATDVMLKEKLSSTHKLSEMIADYYDGVFYPGGHGPLWDLTTDENSIGLIQAFNDKQKPIAFVCHAPAALLNTQIQNGDPLVKDKEVTGFSNNEEASIKLTDTVPFLLEDSLIKLGARYTKSTSWEVNVKKDGNLITGQNPASSEEAAKVFLQALKNEKNMVA
ncbi:MAG: type 1 glutamine amidotransferase domain-containing protein [Ferruginibacter sp.]